MSTAEITAYLAGVEMAKAREPGYEGRVRLGVPIGEWLSPEERSAAVRLGGEDFMFWVMRGCADRLGEVEGAQ